jgi:hypothetical protein
MRTNFSPKTGTKKGHFKCLGEVQGRSQGSSGSGLGQTTGSCDNGKETSGSKIRKFLYWYGTNSF